MKSIAMSAAIFGAASLFAGSAHAETDVGEWVPAGETGFCGEGGYTDLIDGVLYAYTIRDEGEVISQTDTNCTTPAATAENPQVSVSCPGAQRHRCIRSW
jgi:hypothetical protein